jgi:hypothetical protein
VKRPLSGLNFFCGNSLLSFADAGSLIIVGRHLFAIMQVTSSLANFFTYGKRRAADSRSNPSAKR